MNEPVAPVPHAPAEPPKTGYRLTLADSASEARQGVGPILAATSLIIWCIGRFAFGNNMPTSVSIALYTIVPAAIGWLATHVTFKKVTL